MTLVVHNQGVRVPSEQDVWLITGIPGSGKSTVARMLAQRHARGVHLEGDLIAGYTGHFIVSGLVPPGQEPEAESNRQMNLVVRNQCLLARSFAAAGFVPVLDYVVVARDKLGRYRSALRSLRLHFVVLCPGKAAAIRRNAERGRRSPVAEHWAYLEDIIVRELTGIGLWVDSRDQTPDDTVEHILHRRDEALLPRRGAPAAR